MRTLQPPHLQLRKHVPKAALPVGKNRFEIIVRSDTTADLIRNAIKLARTHGVIEVLATTETGKGTLWRVLISDPDLDFQWLGRIVPHARQISGTTATKGSYAKTNGGTWRVAMQLVPVSDEGLERSRLIAYRGQSGISLWIKDDKMTVGFVLEASTPRDGTQICQSALLNMAAKIGVRCEIVAEPRFAAIVDGLLSLTEE